MKLVIQLGKENYVPVRAIPFVTDHLFSARDVPALLAYPERYADAEHDFVLTPYTINAIGQLRMADRGLFASLDIAGVAAGLGDEAEGLEALPDGTVVEARRLRYFFDYLRRRRAEGAGQECRPPLHWLEDAEITTEIATCIARGFNPVLFRASPRRNSRVVQLAALEDLVRRIELGAGRLGEPFDRNSMPGTKAQLIREIVTRHPSLTRAPATLADQLHELGLRWRQGARAVEPYWIADVVGP